jgi:hypothetical protein
MGRWIAVAVVVSGLLWQPAQIRVYQADVEVSSRSGGNAWVGFVKDHDGAVYEFLLEPDDQQLSGWELRLFREDHRNENLFAVIENWHGAQPFLFYASRLARLSASDSRRSGAIFSCALSPAARNRFQSTPASI